MNTQQNHTTGSDIGGNIDFSVALAKVKTGLRIARSEWNGKGMYVYLETPALPNHAKYLCFKTVSGEFVPFVASQTDMLENDWIIV